MMQVVSLSSRRALKNHWPLQNATGKFQFKWGTWEPGNQLWLHPPTNTVREVTPRQSSTMFCLFFLSLKKSRPSFFCVQTHYHPWGLVYFPTCARFSHEKLPKCRKIWMVWERRLLDTENHVHLFLLFRYYEFCKHLGSFFERDPKIVNSVVKYSMMEIRQASCRQSGWFNGSQRKNEDESESFFMYLDDPCEPDAPRMEYLSTFGLNLW